jgi:hypothetical protein
MPMPCSGWSFLETEPPLRKHHSVFLDHLHKAPITDPSSLNDAVASECFALCSSPILKSAEARSLIRDVLNHHHGFERRGDCGRHDTPVE